MKNIIAIAITSILSSCAVRINPLTNKPSFSIDEATLQQLIEKLNNNISEK